MGGDLVLLFAPKTTLDRICVLLQGGTPTDANSGMEHYIFG